MKIILNQCPECEIYVQPELFKRDIIGGFSVWQCPHCHCTEIAARWDQSKPAMAFLPNLEDNSDAPAELTQRYYAVRRLEA